MADLDPETKALLEDALALAGDAAVSAAKAEVEADAAEDEAESARIRAANAGLAAKIAADKALRAVAKIEAALEGDVTPPIDPPAEGLILKLSNVKAPVELPVGKLLGTRTVVGVQRLPASDGKWRKLLGVDSTTGKQGGFCIGQAADGRAEFWVDDGAGLQQTMLPSRPGKASFVAMRITSEAFAAMLDDRNEVKNAVAVPFDGAAAVGAGYYGHQLKDPMPPAEWLELEVWADLKSWDWIAAKKEEWKDLIEEGGTVPPEPIQPTPGEFHVRPDMSPGDAAKAINARGPGQVVAFAPGTYHLGTIVPKDGQRHVLGQAVLEGDAQNKRAFAGPAKDVTIEGGTVQHYGAGGPTNLNPGASGSNRGPWIFKLAAICPTSLDPQHAHAGGPHATNWTLRKMVIRENYCEGVNYIDGIKILQCNINNNGSCGTSGFATDVTIDGCDIWANCRWHWNARDHSSGIKFQCGYGDKHKAMKKHVVTRNRIWDNWGDGVWWDFNGFEGECAYNSIWGNTHDQIHPEAWTDTFMHHNQLGLGGNALGGSLQGTVCFQNAKHCRFENNLVVVTHSSAFWMLQHNKTNRPNISDYHIGIFASCHNKIIGNVFLMINAGSTFKVDFQPHQDFSGDPNCNSTIVPAAPDAITPRGHHFCYMPRSITDFGSVIDGNTYRMPNAGQSPVRQNWPNETNAKVIAPGNPASFTPNWQIIPAWETPPGRG